MYSEDYLCPVCGNELIPSCGGLWCENCEETYEPWECANTLKTLEEDYQEQKAIDRFYGLGD